MHITDIDATVIRSYPTTVESSRITRTTREAFKHGTRWDRCKPSCGCIDPNEADRHCGCTSGKCERDSRSDAARRVYALAVTVSMTGANNNGYVVCPITGNEFHVTTGEVDRAVPALGYVPGNIVLVSRAGNQERAKLQQHYSDMPGAERYRDDVADASVYVTVPGGSDAKRALPAIKFDRARADRDDNPSPIMLNVLRGPYGEA